MHHTVAYELAALPGQGLMVPAAQQPPAVVVLTTPTTSAPLCLLCSLACPTAADTCDSCVDRFFLDSNTTSCVAVRSGNWSPSADGAPESARLHTEYAVQAVCHTLPTCTTQAEIGHYTCSSHAVPTKLRRLPGEQLNVCDVCRRLSSE